MISFPMQKSFWDDGASGKTTPVCGKNNDDAEFREKCLRLLIETNLTIALRLWEYAFRKRNPTSASFYQLLEIWATKWSVISLYQQTLWSSKVKRLRTKEQQASDPDPRFCQRIYKRGVYKPFWQDITGSWKTKSNQYPICSKIDYSKKIPASILSYLRPWLSAQRSTWSTLCDRPNRTDGTGQAIQTLAKIGDEKAIPFLRSIVKDVQNESIRCTIFLASYAIQALAQLGDVEVINMILTSWEDD